MWKDPIVEEVRKTRQENSKKFKNDIKAIIRDAKRRQRKEKRKTVSFVPRIKKVS